MIYDMHKHLFDLQHHGGVGETHMYDFTMMDHT
jgi:hypothetical protein